MCLIKFRPNQEEELIIPNRPVRVEGLPPPSKRSQHSLGGVTPNLPHDSGHHLQDRNLSSGNHAVVIEQLSSRGSAVQTRQSSYSYKDALVPTVGSRTVQQNGLLTTSHGMSQGPLRKSGSLSQGRTPRQSNASLRTTRERIVVIDDTGRRREYYKRDDSGR
jgi:hypothetical protein